MRRIKKPLDDKIKFIPCNENRLIYSYTRTDKKSTRKEKIDFIFEWAGEEYETEEELIALAYSSNIRLNEIIVNIKDWYE